MGSPPGAPSSASASISAACLGVRSSAWIADRLSGFGSRPRRHGGGGHGAERRRADRAALDPDRRSRRRTVRAGDRGPRRDQGGRAQRHRAGRPALPWRNSPCGYRGRHGGPLGCDPQGGSRGAFALSRRRSGRTGTGSTLCLRAAHEGLGSEPVQRPRRRRARHEPFCAYRLRAVRLSSSRQGPAGDGRDDAAQTTARCGRAASGQRRSARISTPASRPGHYLERFGPFTYEIAIPVDDGGYAARNAAGMVSRPADAPRLTR